MQILLIGVILAQCTANERADLILKNGKVYTVDENQSIAQAVAVKDGKILFVGDDVQLKKYIDDETTVIDLQGKTVTPGFIEGHGHIMGIGYNELELDLLQVTSYEKIIDLVREAVRKAPPGQWIIGRGWHQDKWTVKPGKTIKGFPLHHALSEVSPMNPVFLVHASGHAALANARAMEIAGVNPLSKEALHDHGSEGGEMLTDDAGNPTGLFIEHAMTLIKSHIPDRTEETDRQAFELAIQICQQNGITSFHDAGATREHVDLFKAFKAEDKLKLRMYVMLSGSDPALLQEWFQKGPEIDTANLLTIRSIKLHCDGALGSRGAWLLEPYSDRAGFYGMATYPMDSVLAVSRRGLNYGFQVCSHAIGDRANREVLDRYEQAFKENPGKAKDHRFRIEHAQHIDPADLPRFSKMGVLPAMQAIHMSSDRPWAIERLGEKRIREGAYKWQTLLKSGAKIINGTDAPVEPLNPIPCFYAAVTRKTLSGEPEGGYEPEERMTRQQALRSYTLDAAYGAFEEKIKGSIEKGKLADFTVLSQDIMTVPEDEILRTEVVMTVLGGKIVYQE
jgi:predicted amidohydrolase YtcJ